MYVIPATARIKDADAAVDAERIRNGEPWTVWLVAGLQFYDYGSVGLDEKPIRPRKGDRLNLVRAPHNSADANAIEVWWRNQIQLGHLPRELAAQVAWRLDAGEPLRAYVADGGDGRAWSARALLVGEAVRAIHERRRSREIAEGVDARMVGQEPVGGNKRW